MIDRKLFLKALRKAVPPTTDANKAVGGLLITLLNETEKLHAQAAALLKNLAFVAKDVGEVKAGGAGASDGGGEAAEGGGEGGGEAPPEDDDGGVGNSTPIPPEMRAAMDAANVDQRTGEGPVEQAPPPPQAKKGKK